ncbi:EAL domain-containing protein [Desulfovibrio mangrovi]|uniref:putative bifunctional diguanylate cyclase/phosphodiesterase n=1 Tax=Desulfovibrio mangrovi TaxID=2976983 RepID=UPI0022455BB3|nr:GGDEF and EAL domain-containing protein [Desulfovibrio mangrovi]UZP66601.1 EAL domain-containing protein [Desulfovibrio mangrovi]
MAGSTPDGSLSACESGEAVAGNNACGDLRRALFECRQRFAVLAENLFNWEVWQGPDGRMEFISDACERICGYSAESFYRNPDFFSAIMHEADIPIWRKLQAMMQGGARAGEAEFRLRTPDGRERWIHYLVRRVENDGGEFMGYRAICRDISERKLMAMQLKHQAWHDPLTDLPNRTLCMDRLGRTLERVKRKGGSDFVLAFVDLDRFKVINDSLGHGIGDQILRETALRLMREVRAMDTVSRIGGDEFVILLEEVDSLDEAQGVIRRIMDAVEEPITIGPRIVRVTASFGVIMGGSGYGTADEVLRNAHIAMHHAREEGWGNMVVFNDNMLERAMNLMHIEMDLYRALDMEEFFLVYQPIVNLGCRSITGFEALVRWNHPERGTVSPAEFIPVSEGTGQILNIGKWVLYEACRAMARWREEFPEFEDMLVSVNLSARQLSQPGMVDQVADVLRATGLPPRCLKLEVTETMLMGNPEFANMALRRLKEIGVKLCIDDFGTGYSSLTYLQAFPIDTLKVDRSFVAKMSRDPGNFKIVQAVVALAHSLGLEVVAEGVEEEEQRIMLSELRCEGGQGYLFSRPVRAEEVPTLVFGVSVNTEPMKGVA